MNALPATMLKLIRLERAESHLKYGWPPGALPSLAAEAEALRRELSPDILAAYDRFAKAGSQAVAAVRTGVCQGCEVKLSPVAQTRLRDGIQVVRCEYCGRFLYGAETSAVESHADGAAGLQTSA